MPVRLFSATMPLQMSYRQVIMRVVLLFIAALSWSLSASAEVDLEKIMKNMALQYKQAYEAQHSAELLLHLNDFIALTEQALLANVAADKAGHFRQGLQQVLAELNKAKIAAEQDNIALAKSQLRLVDTLRKDYHKQREVSIWQLLFG